MVDILGGMAGRVVLIRSVLDTSGIRPRRRRVTAARVIGLLVPGALGLFAGLMLGRVL